MNIPMPNQELIEIDGSEGEGGGQILRTSLSLALLLNRPFHMYNIRKNRLPKPGLRPQHLTCVQAAAQICHGKTQGAELGSGELFFYPNEVVSGRYHFSIGTAGATSLVLQTVYLPLMWNARCASEIIIEGGTHNDKAPSFHFLQTTWRAWLAWMGLDVRLELKRIGFYPKGGGLIIAHLQPYSSIAPLQAIEPAHDRFEILSAVANLPEHIGQRQLNRAESLIGKVTRNFSTRLERWPHSMGSYVAVTVEGLVPALFDSVGAKGKTAERVAHEACEQAIQHYQHWACVDEHSSDQLLLPLVFAKGESRLRVSQFSSHLRTNIKTIGLFLSRKIDLIPEENLVVIQES